MACITTLYVLIVLHDSGLTFHSETKYPSNLTLLATFIHQPHFPHALHTFIHEQNHPNSSHSLTQPDSSFDRPIQVSIALKYNIMYLVTCVELVGCTKKLSTLTPNLLPSLVLTPFSFLLVMTRILCTGLFLPSCCYYFPTSILIIVKRSLAPLYHGTLIQQTTLNMTRKQGCGNCSVSGMHMVNIPSR
jgi:hypothetical protein